MVAEVIRMRDNKRINDFITEALALEAREAKEANALGYMSRALVQATMPHSKINAPYFVRRNGAFSLAMMAHPDSGVPYGSIPRLLMAFITTESVKTKNPELILGDSLSGFMRELGIIPSGGRWGSVTRLRNQMERLFSCSVSCKYQDSERFSTVNFTPVKSSNLWWNPKTPDQLSLFNSTITLSQDFYEEITNSPVVYRMEALKLLKASSMAVDVYIWVTYRNSYAKKPSYIPWEALQLQFGAGYPMTSQGKRDFKKNFINALNKVAVVYPEAGKLRAETDHLIFIPGRPHVPKLL